MIVYYNPEDNDAKDVYHDWIPDGFVEDADVRFIPYDDVPVGVVYWYVEAPWHLHISLDVEGVIEVTNKAGMVGLLPYHGFHNLEAFRLLKPRDRCVKCGNWNKYCQCSDEDMELRVFDLLGGVRAENIDDEELNRWLEQ